MKRGSLSILALLASAGIAWAQVGGGVGGGGQLSVPSAYGVAPVYSSGCGGSVTFQPGSNGVVGAVIYGGSAATCVLTFSPARAAPPFCQVTEAASGSAVAAGATVTATTLTITNLSAATHTISYFCQGI